MEPLGMLLQGFWTLRIGDVITILAVLLAPYFAVHIQWRIQRRKEKQDRKLWISRTLMATRATPLAVDHVQALNVIDVEFDARKARRTSENCLEHLPGSSELAA